MGRLEMDRRCGEEVAGSRGRCGVPRGVREPPGDAGEPVAAGWRRRRRWGGGDRCPPSRRRAALWAESGEAQGGFSGGKKEKKKKQTKKKKRKRPNPPSGERPGRPPPVNPFRAPGRRGQGAGRRVLGWLGRGQPRGGSKHRSGGGGWGVSALPGGRGAVCCPVWVKKRLKRGLFSLSVRVFRLSQGTAGLKLLIRFSKFVPWQREPDSRGTVTQEPPRPRLSPPPAEGDTPRGQHKDAPLLVGGRGGWPYSCCLPQFPHARSWGLGCLAKRHRRSDSQSPF